MDETRARALAALVAEESGHDVSVAPDDDGWLVEVQVRQPRGSALSQTFTMWDEDDWVWLRERILNA